MAAYNISFMASECTPEPAFDRTCGTRCAALLCTVLLLSLAALIASPAHATAPDGRVIVIDFPWFGQIADDRARRQALADVLADIQMFAEEAPAAEGTVLLAPRGPNMRVIAGSSDIVGEMAGLRGTRDFMQAETGGGGPYAAMTVEDIRDGVHTALRRLGFWRANRPIVLDLHVFAAGWRLERRDAFGDLMGTEQATACIVERGTVADVWPSHISLRVEFRIPEGAPAPSVSAEAALIGVLTGFSSEVPNVATRGASGPRCDIGEDRTAIGFIDPGMADNPDCARPPKRLATVGTTVQACRSAAPLATAIGVGLDRAPVLAIVRPAAPELRAPELQGSLLGAVDPVARIGALEVRPGAPVQGGPTQAPAATTIELRPASTCRAGTSGDLVLGQGADAVTLIVSRYACDAADIPLGEVGIR